MDNSRFIKHTSCDACGSSDAGSIYERQDGSTYFRCFACDHFKPNFESSSTARQTQYRHAMNSSEWKVSSVPSRDISRDVALYYGVMTNDEGAIMFPYGGGSAKYRDTDKTFKTAGQFKEAGLFGQDKFPSGGKYVTITEGEFDALAAFQMFGSKYPAVSVKNGAKGAKKCCQEQFEWLDSFENIIVCFDADKPGQEAAAEVAELFGAKAKIVKHKPGFKDANDYLMLHKQADFVAAWWAAESYRPAGIVSVADIKEKLLTPMAKGVDWAFPTLTKLTYGRRAGEIYTFGAGVGVGKTDFFTQQIAFDIACLDMTVGVVYLEQPVVETVQRVVGKIAGKLFHVPGANWTQEEYLEQIEKLEQRNKLWAFDHFGSKDWETIKGKIRYMVKGLGCQSIYLDHLTALIAQADDERRALDALMADMAGLMQELGVFIHVISHLSTPEGKAHEEGGRVLEKHFTGSRAIARWSHFMFAFERDKQAEDPIERQTTTNRVLKDRFTGQATGEKFYTRYNPDNGMLFECEHVVKEDTL